MPQKDDMLEFCSIAPLLTFSPSKSPEASLTWPEAKSSESFDFKFCADLPTHLELKKSI